MTKEQQGQALEILREFVDMNGPCDHFDHHGNCQAHFIQPREECLVFLAQKLLCEIYT